MTGMELTIGGMFASAIIRKLVDLGGSYPCDNYILHTGTRKMIKNLEIQLPRIQSVIEAAEKRQITNTGVDTWVEQLKDAAYEVEDVLDKFEAKRIRESLKGKGKATEFASSSGKMVKNMVFPDKDVKELKSVVNKLDDMCNDNSINTFCNLIHDEKRKEHLENLGSSETSSTLAPGVPIFGRDEEIKLILDMILNVLYGDFYNKALDDPNLQQGEGEGSSTLSDETFRTFLCWGIPRKLMFVRTVKKSNAPEQSKKGLLDSSESQKSMFSETIKKGDGPEQTQNIVTTITTIVEPHSITSNRKLAVIPIVGPGGVGKTTVAKKIYNDESVTDYFDLLAWVYVSKNYDAKKIMQVMLCSFKECGSEPGYTLKCPETLDIIEKRLIETIKHKRFLLILDDLRDSTELKWSDLRSVLCYGGVGSVVVVTTQSRSIANMVGTLPEVTLDVLKPDSFSDLFQYYAFGGVKFGDLPPAKQDELKKIGEEIVEKLHGLPLAGKVIGTLLSTRLVKEFWEDIRGNNWWNIEEARKDILPSICVGYNYLDTELKQCFVFCSIFPKQYVFERERLVQMWIAHGFIQPGKEETVGLDEGKNRLEDIGRKWFSKLVDRSFFQPTLSDGKYLMHDLVRDLAIAVSSNEFCFVKSRDKHLPTLARHMGRDCDNSKVEWKCKDSTRLRTVILFGSWADGSDDKSITNVFEKNNGLRVLDISDNVPEKTASIRLLKTKQNVPVKNAPIDAACQLSHLRFLDLSFSGIESIADEICALCHLQVLDVRGCNFKRLPEEMNHLINLRHLYASYDTISLITNIGKLTKLQELEEFRVIDKKGTSKGHRISELEDMNEISGHLLLSKLQNVSSKEEAAKSQLDKKMYLQSLELSFEYNGSLEILDALKPACNVEILKLEGGKARSLPSWMFSSHDGFNNIKYIHVSSFWLKSLPAFGELCLLEILSFDDLPLIEKVGSEFYGSSHVVFPSLKELKFSRMPHWTEWWGAEAGKIIFPRLQKLHLEECRALKELPMNCFTSSVVELILSQCSTAAKNIKTILQKMSSLARLSLTVCGSSCSIYCTLLKSLEVMHLKGNGSFTELDFVGGLKSLVSLRKLVITDFTRVYQTYEERPYVQSFIEFIRTMKNVPMLRFLTYLHLCNCDFPTLGRLSSLRTLLIEKTFTSYWNEDQVSWFSQLTSLEKLEFRNCTNLNYLPSTLHLLTSLKKLHISSCPELSSLPTRGLPQNLAELYIEECPYLIASCQPNQGVDWHRISHIPFVHIQ